LQAGMLAAPPGPFDVAGMVELHEQVVHRAGDPNACGIDGYFVQTRHPRVFDTRHRLERRIVDEYSAGNGDVESIVERDHTATAAIAATRIPERAVTINRNRL